jgi:hypothetical protein
MAHKRGEVKHKKSELLPFSMKTCNIETNSRALVNDIVAKGAFDEDEKNVIPCFARWVPFGIGLYPRAQNFSGSLKA